MPNDKDRQAVLDWIQGRLKPHLGYTVAYESPGPINLPQVRWQSLVCLYPDAPMCRVFAWEPDAQPDARIRDDALVFRLPAQLEGKFEPSLVWEPWAEMLRISRQRRLPLGVYLSGTMPLADESSKWRPVKALLWPPTLPPQLVLGRLKDAVRKGW